MPKTTKTTKIIKSEMVVAQHNVVFGLHAVTAVLAHDPSRVKQIWIARNRHDPRLQGLLGTAARHEIPVFPQLNSALDRVSRGGRHQGVVAQCKPPATVRSEQDLGEILAAVQGAPLLLVLDEVQDPHNLGACLRSADAAGVHAVLIPADRAVGLTATVRKVACGAAETVPLIQVTNVVRTLRSLQSQGLWIMGAAGEASAELYQMDFTEPLAVVLGAEHKGLRRLTREVCDYLVRIPMRGSVESLNVSVAAGILLFEAVRQRYFLPARNR